MEGQWIWAVYYYMEVIPQLEEPPGLYGKDWEQQETEELLGFVQRAMLEVQRRQLPLPSVTFQRIRVTQRLRIYVGESELKARPMAKTVLLLFLRHPEGIPLKRITDYREELAGYYRRLSRSGEPAVIESHIRRLMDIFNNELNVNITRVNAAIGALVQGPDLPYYRIGGPAGCPKNIPLNRNLVTWE